MIDRINLILRAKNITARQFAEEIGVQPSGMSHILSGRNRPSLDFVMKVVNRYPEIDIKWLMFGEGEMYAPTYSMVAPATPPPSDLPRRAYPSIAEAPQFVSEQMPSEVNSDLFSGQASLFEEEVYAPEKNEPAPPEPVHTEEKAPVEKGTPVIEEEPKLVENRVDELPSPKASEFRNVAKKSIVKVVILYDDHSFSEYYPE